MGKVKGQLLDNGLDYWHSQRADEFELDRLMLNKTQRPYEISEAYEKAEDDFYALSGATTALKLAIHAFEKALEGMKK